MNEKLTIAVFGKRGVGKSSTLNTLFDLNLKIDAAKACTKVSDIKYLSNPNMFKYKTLEIIDLPGVGEGLDTDDIYFPYYESTIPLADTLLWITQANVRAYKHDQVMFKKISHLLKPNVNFVLGANKADILIASHFKLDIVSIDDLSRLKEHLIFKEKTEDILSVFSDDFNQFFPFGSESICYYASYFNWNTTELLQKVLNLN